MKKSKMTKAHAADHPKLLAQAPLSSRFSRKEGMARHAAKSAKKAER
jgi:hypothetical protein